MLAQGIGTKQLGAENVYAALSHLQTDSIQVSAGQNVKKGDVIGRAGDSGDSFAFSTNGQQRYIWRAWIALCF